MNLTRRDFLYDVFAPLGLVSTPGRMLFAVSPISKPTKEPNLVFGVISDTHLRTANKGNGIGANFRDKYLIAALNHFKSCNVDAVVHCGDMAHRGQTREIEFHAKAWGRVFGDVKNGPAKLFVTGNHDVEGANYGDFVKKRYPDEAERAKHVFATDIAANWERIWGEKYEELWHKTVKGYHFFGRQWGFDEKEAVAKLAEWKGDRSAPFFFVQHRRPSSTLRKAIMRHDGGIAFFGHNHWSIANWNVISLYKGRLPAIQCASCEPRGCKALAADSYISKAELAGRDGENVGRGRYGFVVRVYDDMLVIERREFGKGGSLGADWMMPFEGDGRGVKRDGRRPHPFSREELKKVIGEPQFRENAKLTVGRVVLNAPKDGGGLGTSRPTNADNGISRPTNVDNGTSRPANPVSGIRISIPLADGNPNSRVYAYEVEVIGDEKAQKLLKAVYAAGCNLGIGHEPEGGVTTLEIPKSELPPGKTLTIVTRPLSSLGTRGNILVGTFP